MVRHHHRHHYQVREALVLCSLVAADVCFQFLSETLDLRVDCSCLRVSILGELLDIGLGSQEPYVHGLCLLVDTLVELLVLFIGRVLLDRLDVLLQKL